MQNKEKVSQYFPGAITYRGYVSYWDSNLEGLEQIYILKGGPGTGKATLIRQIAEAMTEAGHDAELLWCSSDVRSLDGVIFRDAGLAILDGTAPHTRDPKYPGVRDILVDLGRYWDREVLQKNRKEIISLTDENKALYQEVYDQLKKARDFRLRRRGLYKIRLDERGMEGWLQALLEDQFQGNKPPQEPSRHRFYTLMAPQGPYSFFDELRERARGGCCFLADEPEIGSKVLTHIAKMAQAKGCGLWYCHSDQEPEELCAIYLPEEKLLFWQTDQYPDYEEKLRCKCGDGEETGICRVYRLDSWYRKQINSRNQLESDFLTTAIEDAKKRAQKLLNDNKKIHDKLETYYIKAMDFDAMKKEKEGLIREFLSGGGLR